jgi:hypothetical protein
MAIDKTKMPEGIYTINLTKKELCMIHEALEHMLECSVDTLDDVQPSDLVDGDPVEVIVKEEIAWLSEFIAELENQMEFGPVLNEDGSEVDDGSDVPDSVTKLSDN